MMPVTHLSRVVCSVSVVALFGLLAVPARAATTTYDTNNTPYTGGTIAPGDAVLLNDGATVTGAITNNGRLQFNQTSGTLTMSSNLTGSGTLSLTNAGTLMLTGTTVSVGIGLDMTTTVDSGRLLIGNNGGRTLYLGNTNGGVGTLSINGGYVGNGSSYLGFGAGGQASVTVSSGTWSNGSFTYVGWNGSATLDVTGGSVTGVTASIGKNLGSVGSVEVSGGAMSYTSNITVGEEGTGSLTIGSGGLVVARGNVVRGAAGTINLNAGGTLQIGTGTTSGVLLGGTGSLANTGTLIFNRSNASTYSGVLSGSGAVTKQGSGVLLLSNTNTYSGTTTVSAGVLAISSTAGLPGYGDPGRWSVATGAGLTVGVTGLTNAAADVLVTSATATGNLTSGAAIGFDTTGSGIYTYANSLPVSAGSGIGLAKSGSNSVLQITGSSTYTGPTIIGGGTLSIGSGGTTGWIGETSGIVLSSDSVLQMNRTDDYGGFSPAISGSGSVVISSGTLALTAASLGTLTIGQSAGDVGTLNVTGGYVSNTTGTLGNAANSVGTATVSSGTWAVGGNLVVGSSGTGTLTMSGGLVTVGGTLSRNAASTISLNTGGTLQIGTGGTTGVLLGGTGSLVNNGTLVFNRSNASTYSGVLSGSGAVTQQGVGRLTLSNANSYSGLTTIAGGTIALSGTGSIGTGGLKLGTTGSPGVFDLGALTAGTYSLPATGNLAGVGTLSGNGKSLAVLGSFLPGNSPGTVTLGSGFTLDLSQSGSSVFEITDPAYTAGTYDLVSGNGSMIFGGILNLAFSGGSYAEGTDVLQIFANTGGRSGNFSAVNYTGLAAGQSATFNSATGFITVVPEPFTYAISALATAGFASLMRWRKRRTRESEV